MIHECTSALKRAFVNRGSYLNCKTSQELTVTAMPSGGTGTSASVYILAGKN